MKPVIGQIRRRFGQPYQLLDWAGFTTATGRPYRLCTVRGWCCDCARPFEFRTTWSRFRYADPAVRRCPDCATPGKPSPGRIRQSQRLAERARAAADWAWAREVAPLVGCTPREAIEILRNPAPRAPQP
jgi:hypothetical protein